MAEKNSAQSERNEVAEERTLFGHVLWLENFEFNEGGDQTNDATVSTLGM